MDGVTASEDNNSVHSYSGVERRKTRRMRYEQRGRSLLSRRRVQIDPDVYVKKFYTMDRSKPNELWDLYARRYNGVGMRWQIFVENFNVIDVVEFSDGTMVTL